MPEKEPKREQVATLEVPRTMVDLKGDNLSGREKLTVLKYLRLEKAISGLGKQKFGRSVTDNIALKPVRDCITEEWEDEFVVDLSKRNLPITFRASLGLAVFTTRITEHLSRMTDGVEVFASRDLKKVFSKHNLPEPQGLVKIDYDSLTPSAKADLVLPIVDNLSGAQTVAHANLLYPDGVPNNALYLADPLLIMSFIYSGNTDEVIHFNGITDLDIQARAATCAIDSYGRMKDLIRYAQAMPTDRESDPAEENMTRPSDEQDEEDIHYEEGTKFEDVFPYKDGESPEDMLASFRRITKGKPYKGLTDDWFESFPIHIDSEGRLIGIFKSIDSFAEADDQEVVDMLSGRLQGDYYERLRKDTVIKLVADLRSDMDDNKRALQEAQNRYEGQTTFAVERSFIEALTGKIPEVATEKEIDEDKRLAKDASRAISDLGDEDIDISTEIAVYSERPVDPKAVELDLKILSAIKMHFKPSLDTLARLSIDGSTRTDNIGDWFESVSQLLKRYQDTIQDPRDLFSILDIAPTNVETEIKRAYRGIARACHPDRMIGATPDEVVDAKKRFMEATAAYKTIKSQQGTNDTRRLSPTYYLGRISRLFDQDTNLEEEI